MEAKRRFFALAGVFSVLGLFLIYKNSDDKEIPLTDDLIRENSNHIFDKSAEKDLVMDAKFRARRQQVRSACYRYFYMPEHPNRNWAITDLKKTTIYLDDDHKVLFCSVPKVASKNWHTFFSNLNNKKGRAVFSPLRSLSDFENEDVERIWTKIKNYTKIIWVRNPFERLLSAWRDKFLLKNNYYWQTLGKRIMEKFSTNASQAGENVGGPVSLEQFFQFLDSPQYISDVHWEPFYKMCLPCHINYNFIGKLEDGDTELNYVARKISGSGNLNFTLQTASDGDDIQRKSVAMSQLIDIPRPLLRKIVNMYTIDFDMFSYQTPSF